MKHFLILLLSVFCAVWADTGTDFNKQLKDKLEDSGYTAGDKFSISVTLSNLPTNKASVKLADKYYIVNREHWMWGLNSQQNDELQANKEWSHQLKENHKHVYVSVPKTLPILWAQNK